MKLEQSLPRTPDEDEISPGGDALARVTRSIPTGYIDIDTKPPDVIFALWEQIELLEKVAPEILGEGAMLDVFYQVDLGNKSISSIARFLSMKYGKRVTPKTVRSLRNQARKKIRVFYENAAKKVRNEERLKNAARHGRVAS